MTDRDPYQMMELRLRQSGALVLLGLVIEVFTFYWAHPLSFFAFAIVGAGAIALGILLYLLSLVNLARHPLPDRRERHERRHGETAD